MIADPTQRFTDRAEPYARWRPSYPAALVEFLSTRFAPSKTSAIADIGSGTGILTRLLVELGNPVFAVEPNDAMRNGRIRSCPASQLSQRQSHRRSDDAGRSFDSVDHRGAGISLVRSHKNPHRVRADSRSRRLGGAGLERKRESPKSFGAAYRKLSDEYRADRAGDRRSLTRNTQAFKEFFAPQDFQIAGFENEQTVDLKGLTGRVLSSSQMPMPGHPRYDEMMRKLRGLFDEFQTDGVVRFDYDARVYFGHLF